MHYLDQKQRDVLVSLHEDRAGRYFREKWEKTAILELCDLGLVCDPSGDEDTEALFTRITDKGVEVAQIYNSVDDMGVTGEVKFHYEWAANVGREARDLNVDFEEYRQAARVIMLLDAKVKELQAQLSDEPAPEANSVMKND